MTMRTFLLLMLIAVPLNGQNADELRRASSAASDRTTERIVSSILAVARDRASDGRYCCWFTLPAYCDAREIKRQLEARGLCVTDCPGDDRFWLIDWWTPTKGK